MGHCNLQGEKAREHRGEEVFESVQSDLKDLYQTAIRSNRTDRGQYAISSKRPIQIILNNIGVGSIYEDYC